MFLLRCPKCKQKMNYQPRSKNIISKSKRCVYCGRSFVVRKHIVKKL
jgi:ribosomal protein S30